jgi:hypothetical protein
MKTTLLILTILTVLSPRAQSEPGQPASGQAYAVSSANPRLPWWFNNPNPSYADQSRIYANQSGMNLTASDLGARLANLQNALQQALPALSSFNQNLPPANPKPADAASESAKAAAAGTIPAPTGDNFGVNEGNNFSSRASGNAGQNVSTPVGYTPPSPASASGFAAVVPPTVRAATSPFGPSQAPTSTGENEAVTPSTPEAIRQLLTLQAEIQRMLPVVASLNGGGLNLASGLAPANVPYSFGATTNQQLILTPTGR